MTSERFKLVAAVYMLLLKDGKVFLSRRLNSGWEDGKYSLVGGHLDGGESATSAAAREIREETGAFVKEEDLKFVNITHSITNDERIHISFLVEKWDGEISNNEPEKASEIGWFDLDILPEDITDISRSIIEWYKKGQKYTEFGWKK